MTDCSWVLVDLVVITTLVGLVTKEVDSIILDTIWLLGLVLEMLQTVSLVPSSWEHVERDLTSNGVSAPYVSIANIKPRSRNQLT